MAPSASPSRTPRYRFAAALTAAAGAVHLAGGATHMAEGLLLGLAFLAVGWGQLLLAARLARGTEDRRWLLATAVLHLAALASWALSRTAGLPLLHPQPEPFAAAGILTMLFEVAAVGLLTWRLARPGSLPGHSRRVTATLAATWALVLGGSAVAVADLGSSEHGHGATEEASEDLGHESDHGDVSHGDNDDSHGETPTGDSSNDKTTSEATSSTPENATSTDAEQATTSEHSSPPPTESPSETSTIEEPTSGETGDDGHDHTH